MPLGRVEGPPLLPVLPEGDWLLLVLCSVEDNCCFVCWCIEREYDPRSDGGGGENDIEDEYECCEDDMLNNGLRG